MAIPTTQRNALVDRNFGVSPAANRYLALTSTMPTDGAAGTELTGSGYARQAVTFDAAASGATSNSNAPTFTASGGDWSEAVGIEIYDASTGGTRVYWDDLDVAKTVQDGDSLEFPIGSIDYSFNAS